MVPHTRTRHASKTAFKIVIVGVLVIIFVWISTRVTKSSVVSPVPESTASDFFIPFFTKKKDPADLKKKLMEMAGGQWKNYSIVITSYTSNFSLDINGSMIYSAASVNKLPILAALYYFAQKGDIDLNEVITLQAADIQDYGTGSIRYDAPGTTYSVKTLAMLMMQKSDNTAAYIIANHIVGLDKIQQLVNTWGLSQTDMTENTTSNRDIEKLMTHMYKERITNHAYTLEMMSLLKNSDFENRIPTLLPKSVTVYHKIGNGIGSVHDAGIVVGPKTQYYIGILTSDITDEEGADALMESLSKTIYDFLN